MRRDPDCACRRLGDRGDDARRFLLDPHTPVGMNPAVPGDVRQHLVGRDRVASAHHCADLDRGRFDQVFYERPAPGVIDQARRMTRINATGNQSQCGLGRWPVRTHPGVREQSAPLPPAAVSGPAG